MTPEPIIDNSRSDLAPPHAEQAQRTLSFEMTDEMLERKATLEKKIALLGTKNHNQSPVAGRRLLYIVSALMAACFVYHLISPDSLFPPEIVTLFTFVVVAAVPMWFLAVFLENRKRQETADAVRRWPHRRITCTIGSRCLIYASPNVTEMIPWSEVAAVEQLSGFLVLIMDGRRLVWPIPIEIIDDEARAEIENHVTLSNP